MAPLEQLIKMFYVIHIGCAFGFTFLRIVNGMKKVKAEVNRQGVDKDKYTYLMMQANLVPWRSKEFVNDYVGCRQRWKASLFEAC